MKNIRKFSLRVCPPVLCGPGVSTAPSLRTSASSTCTITYPLNSMRVMTASTSRRPITICPMTIRSFGSSKKSPKKSAKSVKPVETAAALTIRDEVLGESSVREISKKAHEGLYDLDAFKSARESELHRIDQESTSKSAGWMDVSVPNETEQRVLYKVPQITVDEIKSHFAINKAWRDEQQALQVLTDLIRKMDRSKVAAQISIWGTKTYSDASGELDEVIALLELLVKTASTCSNPESVLVRNFSGNGKHALVLPATNFPLLALKDTFYLMMQGYSVTLAVQPRYHRIYADLALLFKECGLPDGLFTVIPMVTRKAEPALLEATKYVQALRFTGGSALFRKLVSHAHENGNKNLDFGGEISGINKTVVAESVKDPQIHPAVVAGLHWSVTANNGELCSSTSVIETSMGKDQRAVLTRGIFNRDRSTGMYGDWQAKLLNRGDKQLGAQIIDEGVLRKASDSQVEETSHASKAKATQAHDEPPKSTPQVNRTTSSSGSAEVKEYWDKTAMFAPFGTAPTYDSLTHCVYASTLKEALDLGASTNASNVYVCAAPDTEESSDINDITRGNAPDSITQSKQSRFFARMGTTGAKIPESVFGAMKTYTSSVGGNHDGVGTAQWLSSLVRVKPAEAFKTRGKLVFGDSVLNEDVEELLDFLPPGERRIFHDTILPGISSVFQTFAEKPAIHGPYSGQPMVIRSESETISDAPEKTSVVSLKALRSARKHYILSTDSIDEDVIKSLAVEYLSPFKGHADSVDRKSFFAKSDSSFEAPVGSDFGHIHIHVVLNPRNDFKLIDPMRSFVRFTERVLKANVHIHKDWSSLVNFTQSVPVPPYFFATKKSLLPEALTKTVVSRSGFVYEGIPTDPVGVFRQHTTTQALALGVTADGVQHAKDILKELHEHKLLKKGWKVNLVTRMLNEDEEDYDSIDWNGDELETSEAEHKGVVGQESRLS